MNNVLALITRVIIALITITVLCAKSPQSCTSLCDPMDCSLPGSSVHGIFPERILELVAKSSLRGSSGPRDWTRIFCIACRFFTAEYNINSTLWYYATEFHLYIRKFIQTKTMKWTQFYWCLNNIFFQCFEKYTSWPMESSILVWWISNDSCLHKSCVDLRTGP